MKTSMKTLAAAATHISSGKTISQLADCGAIILALTVTQAVASENEQHEFKVQSQVLVRPLDKVNFTDGVNYNTTLTFTTGIGSGAYHYPGDDENTVYTISDRGVNVKCKDDIKVFGADVCVKGKIFPVINYAPSIFKLQKQPHNDWKIVEVVQLKDSNGKQISGLPTRLLPCQLNKPMITKVTKLPLMPTDWILRQWSVCLMAVSG